MEENTLNTPSPDLSAILGEILSNKELMNKIDEIVGKTNTQNKDALPTTQTSDIDSLLANPEIIAKLPNVIGAIKPLLSVDGVKDSDIKAPATDKRLALLLALKPYLSPKRCEAIDYFAKMSKLSQTVKGLKL